MASTTREAQALADWVALYHRNLSTIYITHGHFDHFYGLSGLLSQDDIEVYVGDCVGHGDRAFTGGLNWYRNTERNWELLAAFRGSRIEVAALYIGGDRDMVVGLCGGPDAR